MVKIECGDYLEPRYYKILLELTRAKTNEYMLIVRVPWAIPL